MMEHKGYQAHIEIDEEHDILHGEVVGLRDVVTFQGRTIDELRSAFVDSVEDYLEFCRERGERPEKPFSGKFVVRISPDLHRRLALEAAKAGKSLNALVVERLASTQEAIAPE